MSQNPATWLMHQLSSLTKHSIEAPECSSGSYLQLGAAHGKWM